MNRIEKIVFSARTNTKYRVVSHLIAYDKYNNQISYSPTAFLIRRKYVLYTIGFFFNKKVYTREYSYEYNIIDAISHMVSKYEDNLELIEKAYQIKKKVKQHELNKFDKLKEEIVSWDGIIKPKEQKDESS